MGIGGRQRRESYKKKSCTTAKQGILTEEKWKGRTEENINMKMYSQVGSP